MIINTLEEKILDNILKDASDQYVDNILNDIPEDFEKPTFSLQFEKDMNKLIKSNFKPSSSKTASAAAIFLIVLGLSITQVEAVRLKIMTLFLKSYKTHTSLSVADKGTMKIREIEVGYLSDFELVKEEYNPNRYFAQYSNDQNFFHFYQETLSTTNNVDTEDADYGYMEVKDMKVFYSHKDLIGIYVWYDENYFYKIVSDIEEEKLIEIIELVISNK